VLPTGPIGYWPEPVPMDTDYAMLVESDVPIVVQHTRIDTRQAEAALLNWRAGPSTDGRSAPSSASASARWSTPVTRPS